MRPKKIEILIRKILSVEVQIHLFYISKEHQHNFNQIYFKIKNRFIAEIVDYLIV